MNEAYKITSYGYIPLNWEDLTIGELVKFSGGAQPPRNTFVFEQKEGYIRLIQTRDYKSDKYKTFIPVSSVRKTCTKDDIMIGRYGPPIFQILRGLEGAYNVALIKAIPNEEKIIKDYLYYFITQYDVWAFVENLSQRSGGQTGVDLDKLKGYPLPLPPKFEQQKIAEILSKVDEKIEVVGEQIVRTQDLKKGLMQRLLTKGIGHNDFKPSPLGEIPVSWDIKELRDVTTYVDYRGKTPPKVSSGTFLVTARNIRNGKINYDISKEYVPTELYDAIMGRGKPAIGDVLITTEAPMGEVASIDKKEVALAQRIIKYRGNEGVIDNNYLKHCFMSQYFQESLEHESTGSTVKGIKGSRLHKLRIFIPPLLEQLKLAEILSTVDEKLEVLHSKKGQYQELKKGLMQKLLTGKLRVKNLIEEPELA